ncbi:MAG TPA: helix-turn-helix transcriptional regulator [Puia sp.]|jgi:AraC-like DNA-binding protein|nr:helix-turn-helix transcriptional regulator [Puia sp.]
MTRFSCQLHDFRHWLTDFAKLLGQPICNGRLELPPYLGEGYIRAGHLPAGVSYVIMDFSLTENISLIRLPSREAGLCLFFHPAPLLTTTRKEEETVLSPDYVIKRVGLFFPALFLHRHIRRDILDCLFRYTENHHVPDAKDPFSFEYKPMLEDIFSIEDDSALLHLTLHNRILLLAEKFLHSFLSRATYTPQGKTWVRSKEKDLQALKNIVQILSDSQLSQFPSIDTLSRTAMMSSTKLKTRFKQIYGMKLYEFYNRNRLEQAREMLRTGNYTVKQVGINIGFSNLSNFAKAFRKEFGLLPKEVLKNR